MATITRTPTKTMITLEISEDLALRLSEILDTLPEQERNNYAVALMREGLAAREEEQAEIMAALQESKAQDEAGQFVTLEELDQRIARIEARHSGNTLQPVTERG
jgi:predicted transcriptional regulator